MNISGRFILYGPLVILLIIFLYKWFSGLTIDIQKEIKIGVYIFYSIYNVVGLIMFWVNYSKDGYKYYDRVDHQSNSYIFNFDNYIYKAVVKDKNNNIITNGYEVAYYYNEKFSILRIGSILCWILYVWYHIDRYFSNLIIKI